MRITCPFCGPRDRREFIYMGAEDYLTRPSEGDWASIDDHLHLRDNPAGALRELWYHEAGCAAWLRVTRDTVSHVISDVVAVADAGASGGDISGQKKPGGGA